jgi:peptide deformylase|tara:strand:+ start:2984 stop:3487 length:504 start_codon:yes stop_codon:yes gene_type:complete
MALRTILEFPDMRLRTIATPVINFDSSLSSLIKDMLETMYSAGGIGLAATQIDVHQRILVIDVSENRDKPQIFVNPTFTVSDQQNLDYDEGCLSIPGFYETISRPKKVVIHSQDQHGKHFDLEADGILAVCIQHEIDHLDGKLMVDYISRLKRNRIRSKLEKKHKAL